MNMNQFAQVQLYSSERRPSEGEASQTGWCSSEASGAGASRRPAPLSLAAALVALGHNIRRPSRFNTCFLLYIVSGFS